MKSLSLHLFFSAESHSESIVSPLINLGLDLYISKTLSVGLLCSLVCLLLLSQRFCNFYARFPRMSLVGTFFFFWLSFPDLRSLDITDSMHLIPYSQKGCPKVKNSWEKFYSLQDLGRDSKPALSSFWIGAVLSIPLRLKSFQNHSGMWDLTCSSLP